MKSIKNLHHVFIKKLRAVMLLFVALLPIYCQADDTATLQAKLNAGNVTLAAGATYYVTGLNVTHALNLNGATITMTAATGAAIKMTTAGASVTNGTIIGPWDYTAPPSVSGAIGMRMLASNCTITNVHVTQFPSYGILAGAYNNPTVTDCIIDKVGYIAFYFDAETIGINGGTFSDNIVDRSMLTPSTVQQLAVGIRGSTNSAACTTSGWMVTGNIIKMPYLPANWSAECIEVRYFNNSIVANNTLIGGSIGISVVRSTGVTVSGNAFSNSQLEALEFADSNTCYATTNTINSSSGDGILLDGVVGSNGITISSNIISNTTKDCIHAYTKTKNVIIRGCTLTTNSRAMNFQGTDWITLSNNNLKGGTTANVAILLDACQGDLIMSGGTVANFAKGILSIYNGNATVVTNNVQVSGCTLSSTPGGYTKSLVNGATVGANILVQAQ